MRFAQYPERSSIARKCSQQIEYEIILHHTAPFGSEVTPFRIGSRTYVQYSQFEADEWQIIKKCSSGVFPEDSRIQICCPATRHPA